jgi:hypothetical protein
MLKLTNKKIENKTDIVLFKDVPEMSLFIFVNDYNGNYPGNISIKLGGNVVVSLQRGHHTQYGNPMGQCYLVEGELTYTVKK